jgi:hypothetical protein
MVVDEKTDFREIARDGGTVLSYRAGVFEANISEGERTRGSIDNSPSECADHHAKQERAGEREKEECAHVVLPSGFR